MELHSQLQRNRLSGMVALATGLATPAGSAVARRFAAEGARLVTAGADAPLARETRQEIERMGVTVPFVEADVSTQAGARQLVNVALQRYGRIDTLAHCIDLSPRRAEEGVEVDFERFFPLFFAAASAMWRQGQGSVVLLPRMLVDELPRFDGLLQATVRAGLAGFVHAAALELYPQGLSLNAVVLEESTPGADEPPSVLAPHLDFVNTYRKARRFEDAAQAARFLASSEARGITGQVFFIGGGRAPVAPAYTLAPGSAHQLAATYRGLFARLEAAGS